MRILFYLVLLILMPPALLFLHLGQEDEEDPTPQDTRSGRACYRGWRALVVG